MKLPIHAFVASVALLLSACSGPANGDAVTSGPAAGDTAAARTTGSTAMNHDDPLPSSKTETATFGAGCFWCVEAVLEQVDGVVDVQSGYMGGAVENPTYDQVCSGTSGHAEVVQVTFDPSKITYEQLLEWFWQLHDPTTLNRQGADVGTQYRSAIFHHSDAQRAAALASKTKAQSRFLDPIVTEITEASTFYGAEGHHQDYYRANKQQGYCRFVIAPKLDKLGLEK